MDKRSEVKPDIVAVWAHPPFRDDIFECVLFDPPHIVRSGGGDPRFKFHRKYGVWGTRLEAIIGINKAQEAFLRITKRLCFKWCETRDGPTLWTLMPFFRGWRKIAEKVNRTKGQGNVRGLTYWITFIRLPVDP